MKSSSSIPSAKSDNKIANKIAGLVMTEMFYNNKNNCT